MLQLKNNTPFSAAIALYPNEQGVDTLYTMVKSTFKIGPQWTLPDAQLPPQKEDLYWGEPNISSLKLASDYHTGKAATDIIMTGLACTPQQQLLRQMDVGLAVGNISKVIRVFGDRRWDSGRISTPEPFNSMPLVYERAFGGVDLVEGRQRAVEVRNPVGLGFAGQRKEHEINGSFLPNLECPAHLIQDYQETPAPACFASVAANWQPRVGYAGTYDEHWQNTRAPYLPEDYSPRFMNSASPDLIYPGFLTGGEPVVISGMHPMGELKFNLPVINLVSKISLGGKERPVPFVLETLLLDPNQLQVSLVWRAAFSCDKQALKVSQVSISMLR